MGINKSLNKAEYDRLIGCGFTHLEALNAMFDDVFEDLVEQLGLYSTSEWEDYRQNVGYWLLCGIMNKQNGKHHEAFEPSDKEVQESVEKTLLLLKEQQNTPPLPPTV